MDKVAYKSAATKVLCGVLGYSVFGILSGILSVVAAAEIAAAIVFGGSLPWWYFVLPILIAAAYVVYFIGLNGLVKVLNDADAAAMKKVKVAAILSLVGAICGLIPVAGSIIAGILGIIAIVFNFIGFVALKKSETFPGKKGANIIFIAMIISLCGAVVSLIPVIGVIGLIANIVAFVMTIVGWYMIMKADVAEGEQPVAAE